MKKARRILVCLVVGAFLRAGVVEAAQSEAKVELGNLGTYTDAGPLSAYLGKTTDAGATIARAGFSDGPAFLSTEATSYYVQGTNYGVTAKAYLDDYLTFSVSGGGSAQVTVRMMGNWHSTDISNDAPAKEPSVEYTIGFGSYLYRSQAAVGWGRIVSMEEFYGSPNWGVGKYYGTFFGDYAGGGYHGDGTYDFTAHVTVSDGATLELYSSVWLSAGNGDYAFIDDPLTVALPEGVTFTSASGNTYAVVPEPATVLLCASGLVGLAGLRRMRRT